MDSRSLERLRDQKDDLVQFLSGQHWAFFEAFMKRRRTYFLNRMVGAVKSKDWDQTRIYHALMEETEAAIADFKKEPQRLEGIIDEGNRS